MRLAKHLAHAGVASRRAAEALIPDGPLRPGGGGALGGEVVTGPARDGDGSEAIAVDGRRVAAAPAQRVVFMLHKPVGVVSTARDTHGRPTVVDLVPDAGG